MPDHMGISEIAPEIVVKIAGSGDETLLRAGVSLKDQRYYTGYVTGVVEKPNLVLAEDELIFVADDSLSVRFVHAYVELTAVSIAIHESAVDSRGRAIAGDLLHDFGRLSFGAATSYATTSESGIAIVTRDIQGKETTLFTSLFRGMIHTIVITQPPAELPGALFGCGLTSDLGRSR